MLLDVIEVVIKKPGVPGSIIGLRVLKFGWLDVVVGGPSSLKLRLNLFLHVLVFRLKVVNPLLCLR